MPPALRAFGGEARGGTPREEQNPRQRSPGVSQPGRLTPCASLATLEALGIEVWVRRELLASRSHDAPKARSDAQTPDPAVERATVDAPAREPVGEPAVEFTIRCIRFGRVMALIDESLWRQRRFFVDVARAMHGPGPVEPRSFRFDWPQLRSADAGMDAAGRAFRAYMETQVVEDTRVLAAGARVRDLVGADLDGYLYLDRALRGAAENEALWRRIQKLR